MRTSRPTTERPTRTRRASGLTLLEVLIAASIFAVVLGVALTQINESTEATKVATVQADLRRTAEDILARMVRDLRSTQARFTGATASAIEFHRITGFSPATGETTLDGGGAPPVNPTVIYRYQQNGTVENGRYGVLEYRFAPRATIGSVTPVILSRELNPTSGLTITAATFPGLLSASAANVFADQPQAITIQLQLRRRTGVNRTTFNEEFVNVRLAAQVQLKPSKAY